MMRPLAFVLALMALEAGSRAGVLFDETVAPVVAVTECDFLSLIEKRLADAQFSGIAKKESNQLEKRIRNHFEHPAELLLKKATRTQSKSVPLISNQALLKLPEALRDFLRTQSRTYYFVDADDPQERQWLMRVYPKVPGRIVTVAGNRLRLSKDLGVPVFSDQAGSLTRRFEVTAHPACVTVKASEAFVQIFLLGENDDKYQSSGKGSVNHSPQAPSVP